MEVKYFGMKYYTCEFLSHMTFKEFCVFNRQSVEYLYEEEEYFKNRYYYNHLKLYENMIAIPKSIIARRYSNMDESSSKHLFQLVGKTIELTGTQLDATEITKIHIANTSGYIFSYT